MNVRNRVLSIIFLCCFLQESEAQDPNFSQYFSSPLTLNPANTGNFEGPRRLATNFRNQWQGVGDPFLTGTVSFDSEIFKNRVGAGNRLAFGLMGLFDRTAGGGLNSSYFSASLGYHVYLDPNETQKLSIGFQGTLASRRLDNSILTYANQFTSGGFNSSLPSNEIPTVGGINYLDFNTGLLYTQMNELGGFYFGTSLYHILRPNESFYEVDGGKLPFRVNFSAGGLITMVNSDKIHLSGLFINQSLQKQATLGMIYEIKTDNAINDISFLFGGFIRIQDAIIPYLGTKFNDLQVGLTYDVINSSLNLSGTRNNSIEIALVYNFLDKTTYKRYVPWY